MNLPGPFMEAINGVLTIIYVVLFVTLIRYLFKKYLVFGWKIKNYEETALAIGIAVSTLGVILFRAPIWVARHMENTQWATGLDHKFWVVPMVAFGTLACAVGGLCIIRIMSPPEHSERIWFFTLFFALVVAVGMAL